MMGLSSIKKLLVVGICLLSTAVFAAASVSISISGSIPKFVAIATNSTSASLDLATNYDQNTGALSQADFTLAQISALSNVRDGYEISASSTNNFELENT
ncbi:MAG: hypothetical protein GWP59_08885 [Chlamydiales bacterium]|nr:hypothetical protein [Chlamydiales bacterium]